MTAETERRLLQICVAVACLVPLAAGTQGVLESASMLRGVEPRLPADLDSHYRYLSGLLLGLGLAFVASIPRIEARGTVFRTLCLLAVVGGVARLLSLVEVGSPSLGHRLALVMELGVVPALTLWQARVARRFRKLVPTS